MFWGPQQVPPLVDDTISGHLKSISGKRRDCSSLESYNLRDLKKRGGCWAAEMRQWVLGYPIVNKILEFHTCVWQAH